MILFIFLFDSFVIAAVPPMPKDPFSDEAFAAIKNYYQITDKLPEVEIKSAITKVNSTYTLQTVQLSVRGYPDVILTLKMPKVFTPPLPALMLFTGFQTGAQAVNLLGDPDNVIYVGFQYPWPIEPKGSSLRWDWHRMEVIPVLMSVAIAWLHRQPFIDNEKINIINVSFGTLFYPLAQRLLSDLDIWPKTVVFGYGGVEIAEVIGNELRKNLGTAELEVAKNLIRAQTWFLEPKYHLFHLEGPFLVVNGDGDTVFPQSSKEGLASRLPAPKKIVNLPGPHIQPDQKEVIQSFLREVEIFLKENNAL